MDWNEVFLIIIDKAIIGLLLLIVGLWINKKLSSHKTDLEEGLGTKVRIAEARLPAYKSLWELTSPTSAEMVESLTTNEREALIVRLRKWYYEDGQGIFLSENSHSQYYVALKTLGNMEIKSYSNEQITKSFSSLRRSLKNEIGIYGRVSDYKYRLAKDYKIHIEIKKDIVTDFIELTSNGDLKIKKGYAWDGPSGPTINTKSSMRGSLVHDALYQLMRESFIEFNNRKYVDDLLNSIVVEDGMSRVRAWYVYKGVQVFGAEAGMPHNPLPSSDEIIYYDNKTNVISSFDHERDRIV